MMPRYKAGQFSGQSARLLYPQFWRSPSLAHLSDGARLLYLCILNHADSRGIAPGDVHYLRGLCWGMQEKPPSLKQIEGYLSELEKCDVRSQNGTTCVEHNVVYKNTGCIIRYEVDGVPAILVRSFHKWNRRFKTVVYADIPEPPTALRRIDRTSKQHQSHINRNSKRTQSDINPTSIQHQSDIEYALSSKNVADKGKRKKEKGKRKRTTTHPSAPSNASVAPSPTSAGPSITANGATAPLFLPPQTANTSANTGPPPETLPLSDDERLAARQLIAQSLGVDPSALDAELERRTAPRRSTRPP
jgi:hypothetical protein